MIELWLPALDEMTPQARHHLGALVATFAARVGNDLDFPPTLAVVDRPKAKLVLMEYADDGDQRAMLTASAALWLRQTQTPTEVVWLCDSYLALYGDEGAGPDEPPPSQDPRAVDALALAYASSLGIWLTQLAYGRGDDGTVAWEPNPLDWQSVDPELRNGYSPTQMTEAISVAVGRGPALPDDMAQAIAATPLLVLNELGIHPVE